MYYTRDAVESFGAAHSNDAVAWNQFQIALGEVPFDANERCEAEDLDHAFVVHGLENLCEEFHRSYARFTGELEISEASEADKALSM